MTFLAPGRPDWNSDGRDWPHREQSRFVLRGGIRWHVQTLGSGPVLLLIHGTGASTHSFRALMPLLAQRFTVVALDLPGHAFTSVPVRFVPSLSSMAAAVDELLLELAISPAVAVGHSAGAALLARLSLDGSIAPRLIVSLCGALVPFRGAAGLFAAPAARLLARSALAPQLLALRARDRESVARLVRSTGSILDARGVELYQRLARSPGHVAGVLAMLAGWNLDALFAALPQLTPRLLLVSGDGDLAIPPAQAREVAALVPNARVLLLPGGHLLHEEQPEATARIILDAAEEAAEAALAARAEQTPTAPGAACERAASAWPSGCRSDRARGSRGPR